MKRILLGICLSFFAISARADQLIVLVPGFFNSIAPGGYFSNTIVQTLSKGAKVMIPDNFSPTGSINQNGALLSTYLTNVSKQNPGQTITLVTHSAGAFYAFYALTHNPTLPVKTIVTLAAPYHGVEWITNATFAVPELEPIADFLSLGSLQEFEAANMTKILASFRLPEGIRVIALAGTQNPCGGLDCTEAQRLSWPLAITQKIMSGPSDGIVTYDSAMGTGLSLTSSKGRAIPIERWNDVNVGLEHWEMVLNAPLAHLVGVVNTSYIDRQQKKMYSLILQRLGSSAN